MRGIGILPGPRTQYIDHLVPLCHLLEIPLLVTDPWVQHLIEQFYPPLDLVYADPEDGMLDEVLDPYDLFVYVEFSRCGHGAFQFHEYLTRKRARSVMCLHGNPDKFRHIYWIERLTDEPVILAYGPQLAHWMRRKGITTTPVITGNYRLEYYRAHRNFFEQRLPFKKERPTILYAPTWTARNRHTELRVHYSSFFDVYSELFEEMPDAYQLVVKLHPNLSLLLPASVADIKQQYAHIPFLDDYPPIYPLLNQVDIYFGDYSSIGYDFLYFDRPLFFLRTAVHTPLQSCGVRLERAFYRTCLQHLDAPLSEKRQRLYRYVYGNTKPLDQLRGEIIACAST